MKKILALLALVLGVVSCQTEPEGLDVNVGGAQDVTVCVSLPETTRANDSAEGAFENVDWDTYTIRYIFQVFYGENQATESDATRQVIYSNEKNVSFPVRLVPNRDYNFVAWADIVPAEGKTKDEIVAYTADADWHYNTADLKAIALKGEWNAMDETRDAYTGFYNTADTEKRYSGASEINVKLTRPFAKLRVQTTDMEALANLGIVPTNVVVKYTSKHRTSFNALTKEFGNAVLVDKEHSYAIEKIEGKNIYGESFSGNEFTLFTDYFFADNDVVQFELEVKEGEATINEKITFNTDIPAKRNHLTTIKGNILTEANNVEVTVKDDFVNGSKWNPAEDRYDIVWDGVTISTPSYDEENDIYEIEYPSELAWLAAAVNGTLPEELRPAALATRSGNQCYDFAGKTFRLTRDIDLGGNEWTPISMSTDLAGDKTFRGTFDGQGHTITGLKSNQQDVAGLFGYIYAATIKNVTIDGAELESNHYAGGVVAWVLNTEGNIKVPFVMEDCHVENSTIFSTPEQVNGTWDNGDKVGGLVGYVVTDNKSARITNCSVTGTTIKAYRDFGGFAGYAKGVAFQDCTISNVTLEQDLTHDYKAPNTPTTFDRYIGRNEGGNTINGCKYVGSATQLQEALNAATGTETIYLGANINGDVTVVQKPGVKITIDVIGDNYKKFNGTIKVHSNSNYYADSALTIKNVKFETSAASVNVIEALEYNSNSERYSSNITVENCTFTATGEAVNTSVAVQVKATRGVTVTGCTATNMHSLLQANSCDTGDVKVINSTVDGCKNGVSFTQVKSATVEGTTIMANGYGVRFDGHNDNYGIVVKSNDITANQPFIVRNMYGKDNTIALEGTNTLTTEAEYQIVITNGSDSAEYVKPTGTYTLTGADAYTMFPAPFPVASWDEFTAALAAGGTDIKLTADIEYASNYQLQKSVTLNLGGYSMTLPMINIHTKTTIKNGTINGSVYARKNCDITFDNVKFSGAISASHLQIQAGGTNIYAKDCLFSPTSASGSARPVEGEYGTSGNIKFENCEFKNSPYKGQIYINSLSATATLDFTNCNFNSKTPNIMFAAACPLTVFTMSGTTKLSSVTLETNRALDAITDEDYAYLKSLIKDNNNSISSVRLYYTGGSKYYFGN